MQNFETSPRRHEPFASFGIPFAAGSETNLSFSERWEPCLRKQIIDHPRLTLATGMVAGLLLGWWVKR